MSVEKQESIYRTLWEMFSKLIREGQLGSLPKQETWFGRTITRELVSRYQIVDSKNPPFIAVVFKIPSDVWAPLQHVQADLERVNPNQKYFHPNYFHITLEELGWEDQIGLKDILDGMKSLLSDFSPFEIMLKGVNCFPRTIYVQVLDPTRSFTKIYERIRETFADLEESPFEYVPHISIAKILTKEAYSLVDIIDKKYRRIDLGKLIVDKIHLVRARPHLSVGRIEIIETISLKKNSTP